jgi:hypothetical protein
LRAAWIAAHDRRCRTGHHHVIAGAKRAARLSRPTAVYGKCTHETHDLFSQVRAGGPCAATRPYLRHTGDVASAVPGEESEAPEERLPVLLEIADGPALEGGRDVK